MFVGILALEIILYIVALVLVGCWLGDGLVSAPSFCIGGMIFGILAFFVHLCCSALRFSFCN